MFYIDLSDIQSIMLDVNRTPDTTIFEHGHLLTFVLTCVLRDEERM